MAFWTQKMVSKKGIMILSLFLIGALHTMIFAFFQYPTNILVDQDFKAITISSKAILYISAVSVSLGHQFFCRTLGLRKSLILGLFANLFGLATLWINHLIGGNMYLVFLNMILFGGALTSVINSLVTYLIIEMPKYFAAGIVTLFAFFNGGSMLAPLTINLFHKLPVRHAIFPSLMILLLFAIWYVAQEFFEPKYPAHLKHLRKGTLIWKEMHYRLGLYFIAIIFYGLTESTFNLWGYEFISSLYSPMIAGETTTFFWLFLILGQLILLIPLYFYPAQKIFYILILFIMGDLYFFSWQTTLKGIIPALMVGGFFCSVVFPILLSMMEREFTKFAKGARLLPFIETSVSVMMGGYFVGGGIIDLWVTITEGVPPIPIPIHFLFAIGFIGITGLLAFILEVTKTSRL